MPGGLRSRLLLSPCLAFCLVSFLPAHAQSNGALNGVPPSVTSMGFGGRPVNGVSPSVTSAGPSGYGNGWSFLGNCCTNFFLPANPNPTVSTKHRRRHGDRNKNKGQEPLVGVMEPAYVPYAEPNAQEEVQEADDGAADADYIHAPGNRVAGKRAEEAEAASAEPVAPQPSTVLIFKDGHQFDVLNYAIVGDTLFDFESGRTRKIMLADLDLPATQKANDDLGVDFKLPSGAK